MIRLLHYCSDKGFSIRCSGSTEPEANQGVGIFTASFDDSIKSDSLEEISCESTLIYLANESPDLELVRTILTEGGLLCEDPEQADLIVCEDKLTDDYRSKYPRRLVIGETELREQFNDVDASKQLLPVVNPDLSPPPRLPDLLRPCWALLRKRNIESIDEGLSLFSKIVASNPSDGDALLDQVSVVDGELIPGKRFLLSDKNTHPYSYYTLLGLLSRSPAGSRGAALRMGVEKINDELSYKNRLEVIALPELIDFERLKDVGLYISRASEAPKPSAFSERWKNLAQLRKLTLYSSEKVELDSLDAPLLKDITLGGSGFDSIEGLRQCTHLQRVDISGTNVKDLEPISTLGDTCKILDISNTDIPSLEPLSLFQEFRFLDLDNCKNLKRLQGLAEARITSMRFSIHNTPLNDLASLPLIDSEEVYLDRLPVRHLKGLGKSDKIKSLYLKKLHLLEDIEDITLLHQLETLTILDCGSLTNYEALAMLQNIISVEIRVGSSSRIHLPKTWPQSLTQLRLMNLAAERIGTLPPGYDGTLDLSSVIGMSSLEDISLSSKLSKLKITRSTLAKIRDLSPLASCESFWLDVDMDGGKTLSSDIISNLSALPECRLRLFNYSGIDLVNIAQITSLKALDLDEEYVRPTKDQLMPIMAMHALEFLQFPAGSLPELGGCTFNTPGKIAKLKLQLLTL